MIANHSTKINFTASLDIWVGGGLRGSGGGVFSHQCNPRINNLVAIIGVINIDILKNINILKNIVC